MVAFYLEKLSAAGQSKMSNRRFRFDRTSRPE